MDIPEQLLSPFEEAMTSLESLPSKDRDSLPEFDYLAAEVGRLAVPFTVMREQGLKPRIVIARSHPTEAPTSSCRYDLVAQSTGNKSSKWYPAVIGSVPQQVKDMDEKAYRMQESIAECLQSEPFPQQSSLHLLASTDELRMSHQQEPLPFNAPFLGRDVLKRYNEQFWGMRRVNVVRQAVLTRQPAVLPSIASSAFLAGDNGRSYQHKILPKPERMQVSMAGKDVSRHLAVVAFSTLHLDSCGPAGSFFKS